MLASFRGAGARCLNGEKGKEGGREGGRREGKERACMGCAWGVLRGLWAWMGGWANKGGVLISEIIFYILNNVILSSTVRTFREFKKCCLCEFRLRGYKIQHATCLKYSTSSSAGTYKPEGLLGGSSCFCHKARSS